MDEKVQLLKDRFIHSTEAYARQWHDPARGTGYMKVKDGETGEPLRLTDNIIRKHINHERTIGVYQLDSNNTVKWLCLDIDIKKGVELSASVAVALAQKHTLALATTMHEKGIPFLVEHSGNRGYHLWVFFSEPVQAKDAYALGRWLASRVEPPDGISVEIFPKQLIVGAYGNLVKLPLGLHRKTMNMCAFVGSDWQPKDDQWKTLANVRTIKNKNLLAFLKANNIEIQEPIVYEDREGGIGSTTPPCVVRMMSEGLENGCIDVGLFKLSCYLRDRGLPSDMALASLQEMLHRSKAPVWTDALLNQKIQSAYGRRYSPLPCSEPLLDGYCSSSCRFFQKKMEQRLGVKCNRKDAIGKISRD